MLRQRGGGDNDSASTAWPDAAAAFAAECMGHDRRTASARYATHNADVVARMRLELPRAERLAPSVDNGRVSPAPDAAQRDAAHQLQLNRRMREVEESILSRAPEHDLEPSLDRIRAVMELLGDPQRTFPVIHVTGTNGKTSTARIIEALLRELGLNTGRFTSPHLHSMLERIAVGGRRSTPSGSSRAYDEVIPFVEMVDARSIIDGGPPMTYFEVLVAVAYAAFADLPVDVAVVEVGMGGSWDATNVVDAPVSVVTPIDLDHRHFLGDTVEEIAGREGRHHQGRRDHRGRAAAGRRGGRGARRARHRGRVPGSCSRATTSASPRATSPSVGSRSRCAAWPASTPTCSCRCTARTRRQNAAVAVAAVEAFLGGGRAGARHRRGAGRAGDASTPRGGSRSCAAAPPCSSTPRTTRPGRGPCATPSQDSFTFARLVGVVAVMKDKDAAELLEVLEPVLDEVVVTRTSSPRAMSPRQLGEIATDIFGEDRVAVVDEPARRPRPRGRAWPTRAAASAGECSPPARSSPPPRCGCCSAPPTSDRSCASGSVVEVLAGQRPGGQPLLAGELPHLPRGARADQHDDAAEHDVGPARARPRRDERHRDDRQVDGDVVAGGEEGGPAERAAVVAHPHEQQGAHRVDHGRAGRR